MREGNPNQLITTLIGYFFRYFLRMMKTISTALCDMDTGLGWGRGERGEGRGERGEGRGRGSEMATHFRASRGGPSHPIYTKL
jgi:hypothetical protein